MGIIEEFKEDIESYKITMEKRIKNGIVYIVIPTSYNKIYASLEEFFNEIDSNNKLKFIYTNSKTLKFPFIMYIPDEIQNKHIILHGNNNAKEEGNPINAIVAIEEMTSVAGYNLTKENAVIIVPMTSNYVRGDREFFPMQASRNVIFTGNGIYKDLFKQLNYMISYTKKFIKDSYAIKLDKKIIAHGFSSSAKFVLRYSSIYPENVCLLIGGGFGIQNILPIKKINIKNETIPLPYPIGIYDIEKIRNEKIDYDLYLENFKAMKQFYYIGENEDEKNDTAFSKIHTDEEIQKIYEKVFGKYMMPKQGKPNRYDSMVKLLKDLGLNNIEIEIYKNESHTPIPAKDKIHELINNI